VSKIKEGVSLTPREVRSGTNDERKKRILC
jgi:hypothetical protein